MKYDSFFSMTILWPTKILLYQQAFKFIFKNNLVSKLLWKLFYS